MSRIFSRMELLSAIVLTLSIVLMLLLILLSGCTKTKFVPYLQSCQTLYKASPSAPPPPDPATATLLCTDFSLGYVTMTAPGDKWMIVDFRGGKARIQGNMEVEESAKTFFKALLKQEEKCSSAMWRPKS